MTLHTPVVFTEGNPEIEEVALRNGWRTVVPEGGKLRLNGVDELAELPAARMNILGGSLDTPEVWGWSRILSWLERHLHNPMPVVGPNQPANDLALWAHKALGWPHGAWLGEQYPSLTASALALLSSAAGVTYTSDQVRATSKGRWPAPLLDLSPEPLVDLPATRPTATVRREPGTIRVLMVAYYAGPSPTVGVQRINYWFEEMERLSGGAVTVDLALATPWPAAPARTHVVPDLGPAEAATDHGGALPGWGRAHLEHVKQSANSFSQDASSWHLSLENYFAARDDEFDVVLISGNPFSYFEFAKYAKRRWFAKTILDYRDPFSLNPRVALRPEQREAAAYAERGLNMTADRILVVNDVCADLVVNPTLDRPPVVIRNGWDDRVFPTDLPERKVGDGLPQLVHAGQVYAITPPDALIAAVGRGGAELHQFGLQIGDETAAGLVNHGRVPREDLLQQLNAMDCGITYSSTTGFETPTKVFDYMALGLDVLILHDGPVDGSALATMLEGVEGIHWVPNEEDAIADWLANYRPVRHTDVQRARMFSRETSTRALLEVISELAEHSFEAPPAP